MMIDTEKTHYTYIVVRNIYICAAVTYMLLTTCAPLQLAVSGAIAAVYSVIPIIGLVLIACAFILREVDLSFPGIKALIAFLVAMVVSCAFNYHYELVDNIKAILWMMIPIFLLYCPSRKETTAQRTTLLLRLIPWLSMAFGVMCAVSLGQYFAGYGMTFQNPVSSGILRCGYVEGRLFGIFTDPNYASLAALLLIFGTVAAIRARVYNRVIAVISVIAIVLQFAYLTLAGSRGATICLLLALVVVGAFISNGLLSKRIEGKRIARVGLSVLVGVACAFAAFGVYQAIHFAEQQTAIAIQAALKSSPTGQDSQNADKKNGDANSKVMQTRPDTGSNVDISNNRFTIWSDAISIWKTTPIVGATPRGYLDYADDTLGKIYIVERQYMIHNAYISVLTFNGVLGALAVIAWLAVLISKLIAFLVKNSAKQPEQYFTVLLLSAGVLSVLVDSLALTAIFYTTSFTDFLFWLFAGTALFIANSNNSGTVTEEASVRPEESGEEGEGNA